MELLAPGHSARKYPGTIYANTPEAARRRREAACALSPRVVLSPAGLICDLRALRPPGGSPSAGGRVPAPPKRGLPSGAARREVNGTWRPRARRRRPLGRRSHPACARHCAHTPAAPAPSLGGGDPLSGLLRPIGARARPAGSEQSRRVAGGADGRPRAGQRAESRTPRAAARFMQAPREARADRSWFY